MGNSLAEWWQWRIWYQRRFRLLWGDNAQNASIVILWWLFNLFDSKCSFGLRVHVQFVLSNLEHINWNYKIKKKNSCLRSLLSITGRQTMDNFWDKNSATITKRFFSCALRTCWCKNFIYWLIQHFFLSYLLSGIRSQTLDAAIWVLGSSLVSKISICGRSGTSWEFKWQKACPGKMVIGIQGLIESKFKVHIFVA